MFVHFTTNISYCEEPSYENKEDDNDGDECIICYEKSNVMRMKNVNTYECECNMLIHRSCYEKWITKSGVCPICREQFHVIHKKEYDMHTTKKIIIQIILIIIIMYSVLH